MARTVRDVLLRALDDLSEKSFRRFCDKIMDWDIEDGFNKITRRRMEKVEPDDVVDLILRYYTVPYGTELTVDVLNTIDEKEVAAALKKDLENVNGFTWRKKPNEDLPSISAASSSASSAPQELSFVDKHREALVNRCALVDPILDGLLSKDLLSIEENDTVRAEKPAQNQMRKLYEFMRGWSEADKDALYQILKEKNPRLIEDLEQS